MGSLKPRAVVRGVKQAFDSIRMRVGRFNPRRKARGLAQELEEYVAGLQRERNEFEQARVRCAIVGRSGTGKSSLINAIVGADIAQVGIVETTQVEQELVHGGVVFVDVPGCGTKNWPRETYVSRLKLQQYDCFVLITADRFFEDDIWLYQELKNRLRRSCFLVRNKFDIAVVDALARDGLTESEVREKIVSDVRKNLGSTGDRVYCTSAKYPREYDLSLLISDIIDSQDGVKRERLIADMAAWTEGLLDRKREIAKKIVSGYGLMAAANGINPVPGFDISVDLALLYSMSQQVIHVYGIDQKGSDIAATRTGFEDHWKIAAIQRVTQLVAKYGSERCVMSVLGKYSEVQLLKASAKYAPLVGPLVAAGLGGGLALMFGNDLIRDCEEAAREYFQGRCG